MLFIFPALAILCAVAWFIILGNPKYIRIENSSKKSEYKPKSVSILIPARNEEQNIDKLLESIFREKTNLDIPLEVIVIDDHSEDSTAEIARDYGATVLKPPPLPTGWKGKPWACIQGAEIATGEWLLFLDADTWFEADGLVNLMGIVKNKTTTHSICPYHITHNTYEQLSTFFNVMMVAGSDNFSLPANSPDKKNILFGQSLLILSANYKLINGHELVKDKVLENVYLSEILRTNDILLDNYLGKNVLSMRMFSNGLNELLLSWKKGFVSGAAAVSKKALISSSIWITGAMFTIVSLIVASFGFGDNLFLYLSLIAYTIFVTQCSLSFRMVGRFRWWTAWLFPFLLIFYQCLFFTALIQAKRGIKTQWKGRDVA